MTQNARLRVLNEHDAHEELSTDNQNYMILVLYHISFLKSIDYDLENDLSAYECVKKYNNEDIDLELVVNGTTTVKNGLQFNQDISKWDVHNVKSSESMFSNCHIQGTYKPKFK